MTRLVLSSSEPSFSRLELLPDVGASRVTRGWVGKGGAGRGSSLWAGGGGAAEGEQGEMEGDGWQNGAYT